MVAAHVVTAEEVERTINSFTKLDQRGDKKAMNKLAERLQREQPHLLQYAAASRATHGDKVGEAAVFYATLVWAILGGLVAWVIAGRSSPRIFLAVALAVASHWVLDLLMHRPDLPIYGDSMKVGLGLWNYRWPAFAAEIISLVGGLALYVRGTRPLDTIGRVGPAVLAIGLTGTQLFNLLVDPATTPRAVAVAGLVSFLAIPFALAWVDRHRSTNPSR